MLSKTNLEKNELIKPVDDILYKFEKVMKPINEMNIVFFNRKPKVNGIKRLFLK
jgi:type I restriction enzyme, S subunit